jgi:LacI family transcriptional regulator
LTGNGYVGAEARKRIAAAIAKLGYIPSSAAASLTTKKTGLLGLVVSQLNNPFTTEVASALNETAREHGFGLVLADTAGDADQAVASVELLRRHGVDGLVVTPPESPELNEVLSVAAKSIPIVGIGLRTDPLVTDLVTVDTYTGNNEAMAYLIGLGHRRIGYIGSPNMASGRYQSYRDSLAANGIGFDPDLVSLGLLDRATGATAMRQLLELPNPPTAAMCANDTVAMGAMQAAHRLGLRIPDQVSVIGFDDVDLAAHGIPPLTTVAQHMSELGATAMTLLLGRLAGSIESADPQQIVLSSELVVRESCAPPLAERK